MPSAPCLVSRLALQTQGKQVHMVLSDGVPSGFDHLTGVEQIARKASGPVDLVVSVDAADQSRTGEALSEYPNVDINIDHHVTNTLFGRLNLVEADSVATCAMLAEYLPAFGLDFSPAVVDALLTGILTDTIGFHTSNMNPKALRIAADLVEKGADLPFLYERALLRRSFSALRYWARVWSSCSVKANWCGQRSLWQNARPLAIPATTTQSWSITWPL